MRSAASPRMHVVRKEDKEARLKDFIRKDIASRAGTVEPVSYKLIALSIESPVAKALVCLTAEAAAVGITIDAVFVKPEHGLDGHSPAGHLPGANCRQSSDTRLLDAHEQLLLGTTNVWIGDCMRRDPSKRDAYECYAEGCKETASWAKRSFERIWRTSVPTKAPAFACRPDAAIAPEVADAAMSAASESVEATAGTRH